MINSEVFILTKAVRASEVHLVIDHNLRLGFDKITVYDNQSFDPISYDHPKVEIKLIEGFADQINRYTTYCKQNPNKAKWISFQDDDEFLYLNGYTDVNIFLEKYEKYNGVGLNMKSISYAHSDVPRAYVGDNPIEKCMYVDNSESEISHIKSIVRPDKVRYWPQPHLPSMKAGNVVSYDMKKITSPRDNKVHNDAVFYHYKFKDYENYHVKNERGRPNGGKRTLWTYEQYVSFLKGRHTIFDETMLNYWKSIAEGNTI